MQKQTDGLEEGLCKCSEACASSWVAGSRFLERNDLVEFFNPTFFFGTLWTSGTVPAISLRLKWLVPNPATPSRDGHMRGNHRQESKCMDFKLKRRNRRPLTPSRLFLKPHIHYYVESVEKNPILIWCSMFAVCEVAKLCWVAAGGTHRSSLKWPEMTPKILLSFSKDGSSRAEECVTLSNKTWDVAQPQAKFVCKCVCVCVRMSTSGD